MAIADNKLKEHNLPPLDRTTLTSKLAEENIQAIVEQLGTLQEANKKNRRSITWFGKEIIVMEHVGKILKIVDSYSKVVDIAVQSNPQVSALVWAGIRAIMQVCI